MWVVAWEGCGLGDGEREDVPEDPRARAYCPLATAFAPNFTVVLPTVQAEVVASQ